MSTIPRRITTEALVQLELSVALRGRAPLIGALVFGAAAALTAFVGVTTFRALGLGAVTPAGMGLVELSVTLPTLIALVVGATAFHGDNDAAFRAMLRAAGAPTGSLVLAKASAAVVTVTVTVASGYATAALALAGTLGLRDLAPFTFLLMLTLLVASSCAAIGLAISAFARDRASALLGAVGAWAVLAVGVDLVVIAVAPTLRTGGLALAVAAAIDPIEAGRVAGLLTLGADAHVLGAIGAYLETSVGAGTAVLGLLGVLVLWTAAPLLVARALIGRREA